MSLSLLMCFKLGCVDITLKDRSGRQPKTYQLTGFFIEDDDASSATSSVQK